MVLSDLLKYFLVVARTTRSKYDSSFCQSEQTFFPDAVCEILGDVGGKWGRGFMPVQPGGNSQTGHISTFEIFQNIKCRVQPVFMFKIRCRSQNFQNLQLCLHYLIRYTTHHMD